MAALAYGPLCRGLLSGRMTMATQFGGDDLRRHDPKFQMPRFGQYLSAVSQLDQFAKSNYRRRVIHLALRWVLDSFESSIALWGAAAPISLLRSKTSWAGTSMQRDWPRLIGSCPQRLRAPWVPNSWRRRKRQRPDGGARRPVRDIRRKEKLTGIWRSIARQ